MLRDKRGYETTYLIHWLRDGPRQRSRILYVFRTPPGVRVGRSVLEPAVMRELEARYPDVEFDWRALVDTQQVVEASPEPRRPRRRRPEDDQETPPVVAPVPESLPVPDLGTSVEPGAPEAEKVTVMPAQPRSLVPAAIEGATTEERIAWLRAYHPQVRERIPHRTHHSVRRAALYLLAERLNPESWVGDEAIAKGLAAAAEALQRLSRVFARKRRRPRRPSRGGAPSEGSAGV